MSAPGANIGGTATPAGGAGGAADGWGRGWGVLGNRVSALFVPIPSYANYVGS
jgi:hypothetical protein